MLAVGQICWKVGLQRHGFSLSLSGIKALAVCCPMWVGFLLFFLATLLWFYILSKLPLSLAYPAMSLSYVLGVIAGCLIFKEAIPFTRWLGIAVICSGIYLMFYK
jgi:drug/metabolite transporter (DMT)-like permease